MIKITEKRFCIKIIAGSKPGGNECVYFNKDFTFEQLCKWKWFFNYRAALIQVGSPKWKVDLTTSSYDYLPPIDELTITLRNKIVAKKRKITEVKNKIHFLKTNWDELFSYEEYPNYIKAMDKLKRIEDELLFLNAEFNKINLITL